jgi:hypothetical protein
LWFIVLPILFWPICDFLWTARAIQTALGLEAGLTAVIQQMVERLERQAPPNRADRLLTAAFVLTGCRERPPFHFFKEYERCVNRILIRSFWMRAEKKAP